METINTQKRNKNYQIIKKVFKLLIGIIIPILMFTACDDDEWGEDGLPGRAYLALTWLDVEPAYLDIGNTDIPHTFFWDEYYRITPGIYTLYYEVDVFENGLPATYAFELVYEIWIDPGEPGDINYDGKNGGDTYFILELTPYGPSVYGEMRYKSISSDEVNNSIELNNEDKVVIKKVNNYWIKASYKQVKPREK